MAVAKIRGVGSLDLTGVRGIELLSDFDVPVLLRSLTEAGVDQGAVDLSAYTGGFLFELWDAPGGTKLVAGTATMLGVAATYTLTISGNVEADNIVTVTYPDRSDTSVAISTQSRPYKFVSAVSSPPSAAYEVAIAATAPLSLANLASAINGDWDYASANVGHGTLAASELVASAADSVLTLTARDGGTWGNAVGRSTSFVATWAQTEPGTGQSGLQLHIPGEALVSTLITAPAITRSVHAEVYGLKGTGADPVKLVTCPAMLHASTITLP